MSDKGVLSSWNKLASRSSFFLLRFIDRLRPQLGEYAELIFEKSEEVIQLAETGQTKLLSNDIENFYEIIGSLLEGFQMDPSKVKDILSRYFNLINSKIDSISGENYELVIDYIRRINMLLKSIKEKTASQSKELLLHMSGVFSTICIQIKYPVHEYTVYLQKWVNLVGVDMVKQVARYIEFMLGHKTQQFLDTSIRLLTFVVLELAEGLELLDNYMVPIFEHLEQIGFPESSKSDVDKDKLGVFSKFTKLIQTWTQRDSRALISSKCATVFEKVLDLLLFMLNQSVDKQFRKDALLILRSMLIEFSGCTLSQIKQIHIGNKEKIEERKIIDKSELHPTWKYLSNRVAEASFDIFKYLNPSDPVDVNSIYLVSLIHVVLINTDTEFASNYQKNVMNIKDDIEFDSLAQLIDQFSQNKVKIGAFKQHITKLWRSTDSSKK